MKAIFALVAALGLSVAAPALAAKPPPLLTPGGQTVVACPVGEEPGSPTATYSFRNKTKAVVTDHEEFQSEGVLFNASFATPLDLKLDEVVVDLDCVPLPSSTSSSHVEEDVSIGPSTWATVWCPLPGWKPIMPTISFHSTDQANVIYRPNPAQSEFPEYVATTKWGVRIESTSSIIQQAHIAFDCAPLIDHVAYSSAQFSAKSHADFWCPERGQKVIVESVVGPATELVRWEPVSDGANSLYGVRIVNDSGGPVPISLDFDCGPPNSYVMYSNAQVPPNSSIDLWCPLAGQEPLHSSVFLETTNPLVAWSAPILGDGGFFGIRVDNFSDVPEDMFIRFYCSP